MRVSDYVHSYMCIYTYKRIHLLLLVVLEKRTFEHFSLLSVRRFSSFILFIFFMSTENKKQQHKFGAGKSTFFKQMLSFVANFFGVLQTYSLHIFGKRDVRAETKRCPKCLKWLSNQEMIKNDTNNVHFISGIQNHRQI